MKKALFLIIIIFFFSSVNGLVKDEELRFQYATKLFNEGKYKEAIEKFQELIDIYPETLQAIKAYYYIGSSYLGIKDYPNAEEILQEIIKNYPNDKWLMERAIFDLGDCYTMSGKYIQGIEKLTEFMERFSKSEKMDKCLYNLINCYYSLKDYDKSIEFCEELIKKFPYSKIIPKAFVFKGNSYYMKNDYTQALKAYEEIKKRYPEKQRLVKEYGIYIGYCYYGLEKYKEAINELQDFVNTYPEAENSKNALELLWWCYHNLRENDSAIKFYRDFIKNHPKTNNLNYIHYLVATAYSKKGMSNENSFGAFCDFSNAILEVIKSKGYELRYMVFNVILPDYCASNLCERIRQFFPIIISLLLLFCVFNYKNFPSKAYFFFLGIIFLSTILFIFIPFSSLLVAFLPTLFLCLYNYKNTKDRSYFFFLKVVFIISLCYISPFLLFPITLIFLYNYKKKGNFSQLFFSAGLFLIVALALTARILAKYYKIALIIEIFSITYIIGWVLIFLGTKHYIKELALSSFKNKNE